MTSQPQGNIMDLLREGLQHDPVAKSLIALAHEGKTKRFWMEDDLLYTKGRRLYVPKWGNIRRNLIKECHDTKWAGHPGQRRTRALLESAYYWPQIRDEVEAYVRTCLVCQQDKGGATTARGLLEPLPIAERPWDSVTMDFIIGLPKSKDNGSIIVVVDSDRDPRFTGKFWTELFKLMGSELHFSTSFHPQTDGQIERVNALLELYLRHFATGQLPLTPHTLTIGYTGRSPTAFKFAKGWHEQADIARSYLDKAAKKMKSGLTRSDVTRSTRSETWCLSAPSSTIQIPKVGKVSYKVELLPRLKIHPVFHVSYLKPYHEDKDDPSRGLSKRAPTTVVTSYDKEVEHIIADRIIRRRGVPPATEYLVKWKGLPESEASWEPANALWQFQEQIERFRAEDATRTSAA
ncbi:Transposon Ty3-G Gag-Pol polyprotein [Vitis vinifera]|uniref:Transposon Ty3-G Gag-Pol polyprotein n=1 Tax=Vitis vinifera TaxID=29760 RepID=A0A438GQ80_VITVI|nr:Transposon Ty3-G Gag-Pol polyprotein [Vitis vinifera]